MDSVLREKWFDLSLVQQMINIGNEVKRGLKFDSDPTKKPFFFKRQFNILNLQWKMVRMPAYYQNY